MYNIMSDSNYDALVFGILAIVCGLMGVILVMRAVTAEPRQQFSFVIGLLVFGVAFIFRMMQLMTQ